jgi:long-chain acyl-CoA synthetase
MQPRLFFDGAEIAWSALEANALRAASGFERLGVGEGDVVCAMLRNEPVFLETIFGARRLGAYSCPINWHYKADEAGWILSDSGARVLVVHADLLPQIAAGIPPGVEVAVAEPAPATRAAFRIADALARAPAGARIWSEWLSNLTPYSGPERRPRLTMPYTSGTTGRPKGVRRMVPRPEDAERYAALSRQTAQMVYGFREGARALLSAPMYHSAPNMYAAQAMLLGAELTLEPRFDAERTLALVERGRLTHAYLVPTMFSRLLRLPTEVKRRYDLSSLEFVITMGAPCAPEIKRAMIEWWGPVINESYAASELGLVTFITAREALERPGSAGRPIGETRLRILDEAGNEMPPRKPGLIYTRQPAYPDFTYNNNDAARAKIERDGLWTLGDVGYLDEDGYLYLCDRAVDMVISGGVNIYPAEIEAALAAMPGVADCAVFGIPDAEFGEALAAAVQPVPGTALDAQGVRAWLRARIADYKVPRVVEFRADLPREDSGKIFKRRLREPYWEKTGRRI